MKIKIVKKINEERCWDGYKRNYDVPKGEQGSCEQKNEAVIEEDEICAKGKNYVDS